MQQTSEKQKSLRQQGIRALKLESLEHLSNVINNNLDDLVRMISAHQGQAFNPKVTIKKCLINVILSMVCIYTQQFASSAIRTRTTIGYFYITLDWVFVELGFTAANKFFFHDHSVQCDLRTLPLLLSSLVLL